MGELTPAESDWLRERVAEIRQLTSQTALAVLRIGRILHAVRDRLGMGRFARWVATEFRWGRSTAARMMQVATAFAAAPPEHVARLGPSALYTLAKANTPPAAREAALAAAVDGATVGEKDVRAMIAAAGGPTARKKARRKGARRRVSECVREGISAADRPQREDPTWALMSYAAMTKLVTSGATVRISRMADAEERDDAVTPWHCVVSRDGPPEHFLCTDSLESVLTKAAGTQPKQVCRLCGAEKLLLEGFNRKAGNPFDRSFNCRKCETDRVGVAKKIMRGTLDRTKGADAAKRQAVADHLTAHPDATDREIAAAVGCGYSFVGQVRKGLGIPSGVDREREQREAVRRELRADPTRSYAVLAELTGCHWTTARRIRGQMEEAGEIPRATTRTGADGVTKQVLELDEYEVIPVGELADALRRIGV